MHACRMHKDFAGQYNFLVLQRFNHATLHTSLSTNVAPLRVHGTIHPLILMVVLGSCGIEHRHNSYLLLF
jgi:hypothetical protein